MNWTAEQHGMLGAMGFDMLVRSTPGDAESAPVAPPAAASRVQEHVVAVASGEEHAALRRAVQHAAGGHDLAGLVDDMARLRRDPGQKRALWLRLRTLLRKP